MSYITSRARGERIAATTYDEDNTTTKYEGYCVDDKTQKPKICPPPTRSIFIPGKKLYLWHLEAIIEVDRWPLVYEDEHIKLAPHLVGYKVGEGPTHPENCSCNCNSDDDDHVSEACRGGDENSL